MYFWDYDIQVNLLKQSVSNNYNGGIMIFYRKIILVIFIIIASFHLNLLYGATQKIKCSICNGSGTEKIQVGAKYHPCKYCGGKGEINSSDGKVFKCTHCNGTGNGVLQEYIYEYRKCSKCGGKGYIGEIEIPEKSTKYSTKYLQNSSNSNKKELKESTNSILDGASYVSDDKKLKFAKNLFKIGKMKEAREVLDELITSCKNDKIIAETMYYQVIWGFSSDPTITYAKLSAYFPDSEYVEKLSKYINDIKIKEKEREEAEAKEKKKIYAKRLAEKREREEYDRLKAQTGLRIYLKGEWETCTKGTYFQNGVTREGTLMMDIDGPVEGRRTLSINRRNEDREGTIKYYPVDPEKEYEIDFRAVVSRGTIKEYWNMVDNKKSIKIQPDLGKLKIITATFRNNKVFVEEKTSDVDPEEVKAKRKEEIYKQREKQAACLEIHMIVMGHTCRKGNRGNYFRVHFYGTDPRDKTISKEYVFKNFNVNKKVEICGIQEGQPIINANASAYNESIFSVITSSGKKLWSDKKQKKIRIENGKKYSMTILLSNNEILISDVKEIKP